MKGTGLQTGQIWHDTDSNKLKMWDGDQWITISKMPYTPDPFHIRANFVKRFAFLPHRCSVTDRWIWMKYGIRGEVTNPTEHGTSHEYRWYDESEFLIWYLKKTA